MLRSLAVLVVLVNPALAETRMHASHERERGGRTTSTMRFGRASATTSVDQVSLSVRGSRATAIVTLSTRSRVAQDASIELELPAGAEVSYLAVTLDGQRRIAQLVSSAEARQQYEAIINTQLDPALLEWIESTPTTDRLRLSVFPLTRARVAKVEVIMTLPEAASLVLDPGRRTIPRVDLDIDGRKLSLVLARATRLPRSIEAPAESPTPVAHVDRDTALFLDEPFVDISQDEEPQQPRGEPRGAFTVSEECKSNALAPSCM